MQCWSRVLRELTSSMPSRHDGPMFTTAIRLRSGFSVRTLLACVLLLGCSTEEPGSVVRPRGDGGDDEDGGGDAGPSPEDQRPLEGLSEEQLSEICAPFEAERAALVSEGDAFRTYACTLLQFASPGEEVIPPETAEECVEGRDACLEDLDEVPEPLPTQFALDCDGPNGVVARLKVYTGDAVVLDLKECLSYQYEERERVLALTCEALLGGLGQAGFMESPACAALGLSN